MTATNKSERLGTGLDDSVLFVDDKVIDEEILMAERNAALRAALGELPDRCQQLLAMLISDPPHPYAEIHAKLGIPVGSIGPQRARCLDRLRRSSAAPPSAKARKESTSGEASQVLDSWDDERLLAALGEALKARQATPPWFIETGKNAFAWHNIDGELTYGPPSS